MTHQQTGQPLHYGNLSFYTQEEAEKCQREMNNLMYKGKPLILYFMGTKDFDKKANLIVTGLHKDVTQQEIYDLFANEGKIRSCRMEIYPSGESRGFAYVQFDKQEEAQRAIEKLHNSTLNDKKIEVKVHIARSQRGTNSDQFNNLFVKNLPYGTDDAKLRAMFESFGEIGSVKVQKDQKTNELKDYGYVCFKNNDSAKKAMEEMNKKTLENGKCLLVNQHISSKDN